MTRVLVTGMSGTGKSSVLVELGRRGHRVVDTDYGGWTEEVTAPDGLGQERLWREDRMRDLLAEDDAGCLFVAGCVANQGRFYDRFDAVEALGRRAASACSPSYVPLAGRWSGDTKRRWTSTPAGAC